MAEITSGTAPAHPGEQQLTQEQNEGRPVSGDGERYELLPPGTGANTTGLWAILDKRTGKPLTDDEGTMVTFTIRSSAADWSHRLACFEEAGYGRP